jgi:hypothetical protein
MARLHLVSVYNTESQDWTLDFCHDGTFQFVFGSDPAIRSHVVGEYIAQKLSRAKFIYHLSNIVDTCYPNDYVFPNVALHVTRKPDGRWLFTRSPFCLPFASIECGVTTDAKRFDQLPADDYRRSVYMPTEFVEPRDLHQFRKRHPCATYGPDCDSTYFSDSD